CQQENSIPPTF
nr:immunoglobulin light chain junction region [Macaca mulatta]MOV61183.1 immunoglobulin light chain junction region [Macaca mulatta]MOV61725.1 immunoglobulin light chain junction region [Macaca mulatta]MOV63248.1 immunoglobulin light chain junction region [Macaca mulatta]MOV64488.1 immunoglobulin light chain junction region [Macaca mulatta]